MLAIPRLAGASGGLFCYRAPPTMSECTVPDQLLVESAGSALNSEMLRARGRTVTAGHAPEATSSQPGVRPWRAAG